MVSRQRYVAARVGVRQGFLDREAIFGFTLQTVPPRLQGPQGDPSGAARAGGFSLHAGVEIAPHQREKLERLCRDVSRPPVAVDRVALTGSGQVRYTLKTPYRDGTTHIASCVQG